MTPTDVTDAPGVDVTAANGSVVIADNLTFHNASEYVTVSPGNYTLAVRNATATNDGEVLSTLDVSLENGTAYSAFAVGYLTPGDEPRDVPFELVVVRDATVTIELVEGVNVTVVVPDGVMDAAQNETAEPGVPAAEDDEADIVDDGDNETGVAEEGDNEIGVAEEGDNEIGVAEEAP